MCPQWHSLKCLPLHLDLSNSDTDTDSDIVVSCLGSSSASSPSTAASTSLVRSKSAGKSSASSPVVIDLTNQSYWSWFLSWKLRSWRERVVATVSPVPFEEFDLVPDEIWLLVFSYIDSEADMLELRSVCRQFARICSDRAVVHRFTFLKLPRLPSGHLNTIPIAVMMVGDHKIGKTTLATAFLMDSVASARQGFGTRNYSRSRHAGLVVTTPPQPTSSSRFRWLRGGGGAGSAPEQQPQHEVFGVSLFDVANGAVAPKREILSFPMMCHCIAVCFNPYGGGVASVSEWINKAHAMTEKMRVQLGQPAKAPVLLLCIRGSSNRGAGEVANPVDGSALRVLAKQLERVHGVAVAGARCGAIRCEQQQQ
jgi:hypothetical protein